MVSEEKQKQHSIPNVVFSLPSGFLMSGVTTWSVEMASRISNKGFRGVLVKHSCDKGYRELVFPTSVESHIRDCPGDTPFTINDEDVLKQYLTVYRSLTPATIVPNWSPALYAVCAKLVKDNPEKLRIIGYAHSDESFYYDTLRYYEQIIHRFVASSTEVKNRLAQFIPHRIDDIIFRPYPTYTMEQLDRAYSPSSAPLQITFAGRLSSRQKRIFDLVVLVQRMVWLNINFHLWIYGDGPDEQGLKLALSSLGEPISKRVTFMGLVTPADLQLVWRHTDICILVSDFEGMSLTMLEAMANGCVPVVTKVSGTSIIVDGHNGFLADIGDMETMANRILCLGRNRDRLSIMGKCARSTMGANTYDEYLSWFVELCEKIWQEPSRVWAQRRSIYLPNDVKQRIKATFDQPAHNKDVDVVGINHVS